MYITLETDYSVRIIDCLARAQSRMGAQAIADKTGVTLRFSLKILRKLVKCGILRSYKGALGGYEIAKPLNEISLNDILVAIEGPYRFSRCLSEEHSCGRNCESSPCPYHIVFRDISDCVESKLQNMTLNKVIQ